MKFVTALCVVVLASVSYSLAQESASTASPTTVVDCDKGQSLNGTLAKMTKEGPTTIKVKGTCTEYVLISGFEDLTLQGLPGATLLQPSTVPNNLFLTLLRIDASRSVLIDGLTILSTPSGIPPIGVLNGSVDVRLLNLTIQGGNPGIIVGGSSQVYITHVTVENSGYAAVGVYDASNVHIELCLFDNPSGTPWHEGLNVSAAYVLMSGTTIRNMQTSLHANGSGIIEVGNTDVIIDNPAGTNFWGALIENQSSLNLYSAKLRITNAGQSWGGNTGGLLISAGSTLNAYNNLVLSASQGQGVFVTNNSHASLDGSQVTGSQHGGLVTVNLSSISVGSTNPPTQVGGNVVDLFCDSKSMITGGANISNATTVQCANLLSGDNVPVP